MLTKDNHFQSGPYVPELKLKQLQYEIDSWKRILGFLIDENIHLKQRLSEVLKDRSDENFIAEMEGFQNGLIKEDDLIGLVRHDAGELDKLLVREIYEDGKISREIGSKLKKLRNNITTAEDQFRRIKSDFNDYLSENI